MREPDPPKREKLSLGERLSFAIGSTLATKPKPKPQGPLKWYSWRPLTLGGLLLAILYGLVRYYANR